LNAPDVLVCVEIWKWRIKKFLFAFFEVSKILFLIREWGETTWWPVKRGSSPIPLVWPHIYLPKKPRGVTANFLFPFAQTVL
jgi:hypothetical protein